MNEDLLQSYEQAHSVGGFYESERGLIKVWGKEAVQFLNGLITNDIAKLEDDEQMSAAFPNAQGRALAVVRVLKRDDAFLFETEDITREKVFNNLFRFTFAGDFFVEDLSEKYTYFSIENAKCHLEIEDLIEFQTKTGDDFFVRKDSVENIAAQLKTQKLIEISDELREILRIENGVPKYSVDIDETTIVPEIGIENLISYNKGCYIGQEIIARIYFRGHIAKKLTGIVITESEVMVDELTGGELKSAEGKNAGRVTSAVFSPKLNQIIALAYVRYDFLAEGTELKLNDLTAQVKDLPFV